jgi:hypothetical protein
LFEINREAWGVVLVSPSHPALLRENGTYTLGTCDDRAKEIYINDTLDDFMLKKVLCHEIVHAAMFSYNVELTLE